MQLKEFISNTLTQIAEGVQDAIDRSKGMGYLVNPSMGKVGNTYTVHFDLSVETGKDGKADIKILNGGMSEKNMSRISFDVNMTLPHSGEKKPPTHPAYDVP